MPIKVVRQDSPCNHTSLKSPLSRQQKKAGVGFTSWGSPDVSEMQREMIMARILKAAVGHIEQFCSQIIEENGLELQTQYIPRSLKRAQGLARLGVEKKLLLSNEELLRLHKADNPALNKSLPSR